MCLQGLSQSSEREDTLIVFAVKNSVTLQTGPARGMVYMVYADTYRFNQGTTPRVSDAD